MQTVQDRLRKESIIRSSLYSALKENMEWWDEKEVFSVKEDLVLDGEITTAQIDLDECIYEKDEYSDFNYYSQIRILYNANLADVKEDLEEVEEQMKYAEKLFDKFKFKLYRSIENMCIEEEEDEERILEIADTLIEEMFN